MTTRSLLIALTLAVSVLAAAGVAGMPSIATNDRVATTMSTMRLAAFSIEAYQREHGALPAADGQLKPFAELLATLQPSVALRSAAVDAWGHAILYRSNANIYATTYQLISLGADGIADTDYSNDPPYPSRTQPIRETANVNSDLILVDGRFTQRPFGSLKPAFLTVNAMNSIFLACESYAVDNNQYPGTGPGLVPVTALKQHLVPIYLASLPDADGWGRPLLASSDRTAVTLVSYGADGILDTNYSLTGLCGLIGNGAGPSAAPGADIIQACGDFTHWVAGTEP